MPHLEQFQTTAPPSGAGQAAVAGAFQQSQAAISRGLAAVQPGRFVGSPFAQGLQSLFAQGGRGFGDEAIAAQRRQAGQQIAQQESDQLRGIRQSAAAGGFGFSRALGRGEQNIRAEGARSLQESTDRFLIESERTKQADRLANLQGILQFFGIEAGLAAQTAQIESERQFPIIPGITPGGTGPGVGGSFFEFIDPVTGRMARPPRTPEEQARFEAERRAWEAQNQAGAVPGPGRVPGGGFPVQPGSPGFVPPTPGGLLGRLYGQ